MLGPRSQNEQERGDLPHTSSNAARWVVERSRAAVLVPADSGARRFATQIASSVVEGLYKEDESSASQVGAER